LVGVVQGGPLQHTDYHGRGRGRGWQAHNTDQATSENVTGGNNSQEMKAKSDRVWTKVAAAVHRRGPQDIIYTQSGFCREVHANSEMDVFKLLLTPEMLDIIARETNREAKRKIAE